MSLDFFRILKKSYTGLRFGIDIIQTFCVRSASSETCHPYSQARFRVQGDRLGHQRNWSTLQRFGGLFLAAGCPREAIELTRMYRENASAMRFHSSALNLSWGLYPVQSIAAIITVKVHSQYASPVPTNGSTQSKTVDEIHVSRPTLKGKQ